MYGTVLVVEYIKFDSKFKSSKLHKKEMIHSDNTTDADNKLENIDLENNKIKNLHINNTDNSEINNKLNNTLYVNEDDFKKKYYSYGPFLGQVIGCIKDGFKKAFINGEPRLYESMYLCTFQIEIKDISTVFSVISRRRGEVN